MCLARHSTVSLVIMRCCTILKAVLSSGLVIRRPDSPSSPGENQDYRHQADRDTVSASHLTLVRGRFFTCAACEALVQCLSTFAADITITPTLAISTETRDSSEQVVYVILLCINGILARGIDGNAESDTSLAQCKIRFINSHLLRHLPIILHGFGFYLPIMILCCKICCSLTENNDAGSTILMNRGIGESTKLIACYSNV